MIEITNSKTNEKIAGVDFYYKHLDAQFVLDIVQGNKTETYKFDNPVPFSDDVSIYTVEIDSDDYRGLEIRTVINGEEEVGPQLTVRQSLIDGEDYATEVIVYANDFSYRFPDFEIEICNLKDVKII